MASLALEPATTDIYPGTRVIRIDDDGHPHLTRTRTSVWQVADRWVVSVDGLAGGYELERIFVMPEGET
jgi:hypothetical protein